MRFYNKAFLIFGIITILFNSCKNDLNILAPYKETISVYALLNPQEKRQYIRINKMYLGQGNAYTMATVADSINYKSGILQVSLERTYYGTPALTTQGNPSKMKIILSDTVIQTAPGPFNSTQRLWFTDDKLYADGNYQLKIVNTLTGNTFTSSTLMIDSIKPPGIIQPLGPPYYPVAYSPSNPSYYYFDISVPTVKRDVRFVSVKDARDYTVIMRFHYKEYYAAGDSAALFLDFNFPTVSSSSLDGGENLSVTYYGSEFFDLLYSKLIGSTGSNLAKRRAIKMDFLITAGTQTFSDFLKISAPSTSVAQDKPTFTNIDGGGYGVFTCRSRFHISKEFATSTVDYIATTSPYCNLLFLKSDGTPNLATCN